MDAITDYETSSGMSKSTILAARDKLLEQKSLTIGVLDDSAVPDLGVSPFIRQHNGLYIYTSHLSGHVKALLAQKRASFIIALDEAATSNIWARHRLKFAGTVTEVPRNDPDFSVLCDDFTVAHGNTMPLIENFTDFHMLRITPENGVLVLGFARAFLVKDTSFDIVAHLSRG